MWQMSFLNYLYIVTLYKFDKENLQTSMIDEELFDEISVLLEYNKNIRHIRGGQKTKEKYEYSFMLLPF